MTYRSWLNRLILKMSLNNINTAQGTKAAIFRLHDKTFAIEIACIRKITPMLDLTRINDHEGFIKGVVNLQGQVIVVIDLSGQLGLMPMGEPPKSARIIFIELKKRVFGFIVDQVLDVAGVNQVLDLEKVLLKFI